MPSPRPKISTTKWPPDEGDDGKLTEVATKRGGRKRKQHASPVAAPNHPSGEGSSDPIPSPSRNDVLSYPPSAAGVYYKHHGNVFYRATCRKFCKEYVAAPRGKKEGGKVEIAGRILTAVRSQDPPGRFIKLDEKDGRWSEMTEDDAIVKIKKNLLAGGKPPDDSKKRKRKRRARRAETRRVEEVAEDAIFAAAAAASVASKTGSTKKWESGRFTSIPEPPPSVPILAPTCSDIFTLTEKRVAEPHFGNRVYRTLCDKFRPNYWAAHKGGRNRLFVVAKVVECVRAQNPPGRFLRRNDKEGVWYEMGEEAVLKKVATLLQYGKGKAQSEASEEESDSCEDESENETSEEKESRSKKKPAASINECWPSENADSGSLSWNDMCFRLVLYKAEHGNCDVPDDYTGHDNLGGWVAQQRTYFNNRNNYKPYQIDRVRALNELGLDFRVLQDKWDAMFERLKEFKERKGHADVPPGEPELGRWVHTQRGLYSEIRRKTRRTDRAQQLSQNRIDRLEALGFVWRKRDKPFYSWEDSFEELKQFKAEHGHTVVPQHYEPNPHLGEWVTRMRYQKGLRDKGRGNNQMTEERVQKLEAIGFKWKVLFRRGSTSDTV